MTRNLVMCLLSLCLLGQAVFAEVVWTDASALVIGGKGWREGIGTYRRLPDAAEGKVPPAVWSLAAHSAGLFIDFQTDSPRIELRWTLTSANLAMPHMPATGVSGIDLYRKDETGRWFYVANARPQAKQNAASIDTANASAQMRPYRIYLPLYNGVESMEIGITPDSRFEQAPEPASKPVVYYGTSIAQGACASRPGMAFTAILHRRLDRPIVNLGFSGSGKMEPEMADLLAQIDPSVFVIDCLWNLSGSDSQTIEQRVDNLARTLRKAHPQTPIVFVEQSHFKGPFPMRTSLAQQKALDALVKEGLANLHAIPGDDLLGRDGDGTVDGCHPNDLGMKTHADALLPILESLLK